MLTRRIMLADRDDALVEVYCDHLARRGFAVRMASGGVTCLEMVRQFRPHLLLLSATLPWGGYDGVLGVLDEEPLLRPLYVVVLTWDEAEHVCIAGAAVTSMIINSTHSYRIASCATSRACLRNTRTAAGLT